ncbi:MAG: DUF4347 domain-containing protein [Pseudomonadota bacterium]
MTGARSLYVIDDRVDWRAGITGALWGPFIALTTIGEVSMTSAETMVENVTGALAPHERLAALRVVDHGWRDGLELGDDLVTETSFDRLAPVLSALRGHFACGGFVHFMGCHVALKPRLMHRFARLWNVPVYGGTGATNGYKMNCGDWVEVRPCGRRAKATGWPRPGQ